MSFSLQTLVGPHVGELVSVAHINGIISIKVGGVVEGNSSHETISVSSTDHGPIEGSIDSPKMKHIVGVSQQTVVPKTVGQVLTSVIIDPTVKQGFQKFSLSSIRVDYFGNLG